MELSSESVPAAAPTASGEPLLGPTGRPMVPSAPRIERRRRKILASRRRQVVAGVVILGAIAFVLFQGLDNATEYFKTTGQAVADRAQLGTKPFRIEGTVEPGVHQADGTTDFSIYNGGVAVEVVDHTDPPDLFKAGIPVVLDGHWSGTIFESDLIMVKHSASYVEAHPDRLKSQLPKTPTSVAGSPKS